MSTSYLSALPDDIQRHLSPFIPSSELQTLAFHFPNFNEQLVERRELFIANKINAYLNSGWRIFRRFAAPHITPTQRANRYFNGLIEARRGGRDFLQSLPADEKAPLYKKQIWLKNRGLKEAEMLTHILTLVPIPICAIFFMFVAGMKNANNEVFHINRRYPQTAAMKAGIVLGSIPSMIYSVPQVFKSHLSFSGIKNVTLSLWDTLAGRINPIPSIIVNQE